MAKERTESEILPVRMPAVLPGVRQVSTVHLSTDGTGSGLGKQSRGPAVFIGFASMVMLAFFLPVVLVIATPDPVSADWNGPLLIAMIAGLRFGWIIGDGRRRLFELSFWLFTYVFLGLAPIAQIRTGRLPGTTPKIDSSLNAATSNLVLMGVGCFLIGIAAFHLLGNQRTDSLELRSSRTLNGPRVFALASLAFLFNVFFVLSVGLAASFESRENSFKNLQAAFPDPAIAAIVSALARISILVAFVALVALARERGHGWRFRQLTFLVAAVLGLMMINTLNPISNARYLVGTGWLAIAALFGAFASRRRFRLSSVLALLGLVVVFPVADAFRYSTSAEVKSDSILGSLVSADFDSFAQINNSILYINQNGIDAGRQMIGVILFWVPRSVWMDKPTDTGELLAINSRYVVHNLSAPLWAELNVNGGLLLVAFGMLILGYLVARQDCVIESSFVRGETPAVLSLILPFYFIILLRGSLLQAMSFLTVLLVSSFLIYGRNRPRSGNAQSSNVLSRNPRR